MIEPDQLLIDVDEIAWVEPQFTVYGEINVDLPVHFAHRNHNWLEKSAQSKLFLCEAEIRLFRRYLYDRNQFVKN